MKVQNSQGKTIPLFEVEKLEGDTPRSAAIAAPPIEITDVAIPTAATPVREPCQVRTKTPTRTARMIAVAQRIAMLGFTVLSMA